LDALGGLYRITGLENIEAFDAIKCFEVISKFDDVRVNGCFVSSAH
jgi:hypothetical protein